MNVQSTVRDFRPCPELQSYFASYTIAYINDKQSWIQQRPAFPQQYLIFYPDEPQLHSNDGNKFQRLAKELVIGPFTKPVFLLCSPLQLTIIVHLLPGTLHRLTHLPLHKILNQPLDGINCFGGEMRSVNEQLSSAKTCEQMVQILETFLLKKVRNIKDTLPIDHVFHLLLTVPYQYSIEQLAKLSCVSLRQFERQFLERIGTSPTTFIRQTRFAKALRLKRVRPDLNWTTVAYECGYFDQMHLIRDFKQFTYSTPTSYKNFVVAPALVK